MRFSLVWLQALETAAENAIHQASSQEMRNNRVRKSNFKMQGYIYPVFLRIFAELFGVFCAAFFPLYFFGQPTYGWRIRSL